MSVEQVGYAIGQIVCVVVIVLGILWAPKAIARYRQRAKEHQGEHHKKHVAPWKHIVAYSLLAAALMTSGIFNGVTLANNKNLKSELATAQGENSNLGDQVATLGEQLESSNKQIVELGGKVSTLSTENSGLSTKVGTLNNRVADLSGQLTLSGKSVSDLKDLSYYLIDTLDKMDAILLTTDSNSYDYIAWLTNNMYLRDGISQATSDNYYYNWLNTQKSTTDDYNALSDEISAAADEIISYLE